MARIGDEIFRPIMRALDDAPVHLRQLRGAVDGMKAKQIRNRDGVTDIDKFDARPTRIDVSIKAFIRNKKHDAGEFDRQYNEQMDALQSVSLADWIRRRAEYDPRHRTPDSLRAQQDARDAALNDKFFELLSEGQGEDQAMQNAKDWLSTQAATHRLDGIAGGDVADVSGVGDSGVNSSLGSQWRTRIGDIQSAVDGFVEANPDVDLNNVFMNVVVR